MALGLNVLSQGPVADSSSPCSLVPTLGSPSSPCWLTVRLTVSMQSVPRLALVLWAALASAQILRYGVLKVMIKRQLSTVNMPAITRTDAVPGGEEDVSVVALFCCVVLQSI